MDHTSKMLVVGGGMAGWMTASYLAKALGRSADIQVIEPADIATIGVGEATFSSVHLFFEFLGLSEEDWMIHCNASYKTAIKFVNWNREGRHFFHPFQRFEIVEGRSILEWWLKLRSAQPPFDYACYTVPAICDARRAPRWLDGHVFDPHAEGLLGPSMRGDKPSTMDDLQAQYPYAYHFDAGLVAKFLTGYAQNLGVVRIRDVVKRVMLDEDGSIAGLETTENGRMKADLYIDCTGFQGLLINQALKEPFISFTASLPCDRAVAMQVPADPRNQGMNPFTTATALSAGWVWNIPLYHRDGTGYVYASAFLSPEAAEREFRQHLGKRADGCRALHIRMRVGRCRNSWVKNCVAIGLASGFVEPLESTGIFFIQHGIEQLLTCLPNCHPDSVEIAGYNKAVADCIDGVREFLTLHYVCSNRADNAFWKATKTELAVPDGLAERLALWRHRLPTNRTINPNFHGFSAYSYCVMLLGLGAAPERSLPALDSLDDSRALAAFAAIQKRSEMLQASLPSQYEYLSTRYELGAGQVERARMEVPSRAGTVTAGSGE